MIRRSGFVTMVGGALIVSACGRQVTPSPTGTSPASGVPAGFMQVKFRTVAPFDFTNFTYVIVFNTSGDGSTPIAVPAQNAFAGYSFALVVSGAGGSASATPYIYTRPNGPGTQPLPLSFQYAPQNLRLYLNSNGQGNEFTIIFNRSAIAGFNPTTSTPTPSPTASSTATPSPSPSPTASSSASPSPSPSPTATPNYATTWEFNFFVLQGQFNSQQSTVVDSLGQGGGTDTTYASTKIDTTTAYESGPFYPNSSQQHPTTGSEAILSGDIANTP